MSEPSPDVTFVFTDIEGSTRLWEQQPERMRPALAAHDALARAAVERHGGRFVKSTGDGIHAAFDDPMNALRAVLQIQRALTDPAATQGVALNVRSGLHLGADERRDGDFFGRSVNRAARIMSAAHGGQTLLSQAVAERLIGPLPDGVTLRDLGRVRLRDLSTPERVYQVLHPALRGDFPPLRSLEATPNNLAQQLNSFVGREREMVEVKALLAEHRLVLLLGLGGIGKSRLSVQLGAELVGDYPDGVWLIELAPLTDALLVPQALASVLGVKEEAGRSVMEALLVHVRDRRLLLILDNCEHLVPACADLAKQLLQAGPALKILASSREVLRVAGETVYHLSTLSAPEPGHKASLEVLAQHDAVRLFVERATAAQPAFALSARNAAAVADICHRLDGIPLALELAAARARSMPVETLAARLSDRFRLLKTSDQTVLPRQRTLRALIDWSYDLLDANERAVFQRLSVFAGGWTLEAAEAVCAGGDVDAADVLDLLGQLVEKSLAVMEAEGARYRMLETVRQYAQERGAEAGGEPAARTRHLSFYLALAEEARPMLAGPEQGAWLSRLDREQENFLTAHASGESVPEGGELGVRLIDALRPHLIYRGLLSLGLRLAMEVLARPGVQQRTEARCKALFGVGQFRNFMGRYEAAMGPLIEALAIARETGNARWTAGVLQLLGWACQAQGDPGAAALHLEEALAAMRQVGSRRDVLGATNQLAQLLRAQGELNQAEPLYAGVLALSRELGDQNSIAVALLNLAMVAVGRGEADGRPVALLIEALRIAEAIKPTPAAQWAVDVCAGFAAARGDWVSAARFFGFGEAQASLSGLHRDPTDEAFLAPHMDRVRQSLDADTFERCMSKGREMTPDEAVAQAREWLQAFGRAQTLRRVS